MNHIPRLEGPTLTTVSFTAVPVQFVDQNCDVTTPCLEEQADRWQVYGNDEALCLLPWKEDVVELFAALERSQRVRWLAGLDPGAPEGDRSAVVTIDRGRLRK